MSKVISYGDRRLLNTWTRLTGSVASAWGRLKTAKAANTEYVAHSSQRIHLKLNSAWSKGIEFRPCSEDWNR